MTRLEYELLREEMPHLKLPVFLWLDTHSIEIVGKCSRDGLIRYRAMVLLNGGRIPFEEALYHESLS